MMKKNALLPMGVFMSAFSVAHAGAVKPDAGNLQQQINPSTLPATPSPRADDLPSFNLNEIKSTTTFLVKSIRIVGSQEIDALVLHQLVKDYEGRTHSLAELQVACQRITNYYQAKGYALTRAILPPQEIIDGRVTIQVVEAKYGVVEIDNKSRLSKELIQATLSGFKEGQGIKQKDLDRSLLLLTDIPGVQTNALLKAGQKPTQTDLALELTDKPMLSGMLSLDNWGNSFINRPRALTNLNVANPTGHGDLLSLTYVTTGQRMQYARLSYDSLVHSSGTRVGAASSDLSYRLGDDIKALDANGSANSFEAYVRQPLIRNRQQNLFLNLQYQHNTLKDRVDISGTKTDRDVNSGIFSINGDIRDTFGGIAVSSYSLAYIVGNVNFNNADAKALDAASRNSAGQFSKLFVNLNRLQSLNDRTQLWVSYSQQFAQDNLDSSQKMVFGGPNSVRAYDAGTISGDGGHIATLELRRLLGEFYGAWQGVAFYDTARVKVNESTWTTATGKNRLTISGAGLGLEWAGPYQMSARVFAASSLGGGNALTENGDKTIAWFEFVKRF